MKYEIIDKEVQKTYYYAKQSLDSQGFTQQLSIYLRSGRKNQPQNIRYLGLIWSFPIVCFIGGVILLFKTTLGGIVVIIVGIVLMNVFVKKYYSPGNLSSIESASQRPGSHRLMKIVADEMSKESSMEQIVEALKREITSKI